MASTDEIIAKHADFFAAKQWALVPIKYPRIVFNDDLDVPGYLRTIAAASAALACDITTFTADDRLMNAETNIGRCFVSACVYHTDVLLASSLQQFRARVDDIVHATAETRQLFELAQIEFVKLQGCLDEFRSQIERRQWKMQFADMSKDKLTPSAGPFQILVQMLMDELDVSDVTSEAKARTFLQSFKKAAVFRNQQQMSGSTATEPGDGRPTMMFFSIYPTTDASKPPIVLFGCNEMSWGAAHAIQTVTRNHRDHGLQSYIPVASETFTFLHDREQSLSQGRTVPISKQDLIAIRRQAAIDTHRDPSFLGGTNETGLALRTSGWSPNKPCYLCFGMMGYQQAVTWKTKDQENYNAKFN